MKSSNLFWGIFNLFLGALIASTILWHSGYWHRKVVENWKEQGYECFRVYKEHEEEQGYECFRVYKEREAGIRYEIAC